MLKFGKFRPHSYDDLLELSYIKNVLSVPQVKFSFLQPI